jgi:integrase
MSVSQLPNGRWRAQVWDPAASKSVSAAKILRLEISTFSSKREAERARERARTTLQERAANGKIVTVARWYEIWTTNELYLRDKKPATNINNAERTKRFVDTYGSVLLTDVDRELVGQWRLAGNNESTLKNLRTMFSAALDAGYVIANPFVRLNIKHGKGNAEQEPPTRDLVWQMIHAAREMCPPGFAAWLQVACYSGMRHGELDGLRWEDVDLDGGWIEVQQQFCSKGFVFVAPKNGKTRTVPMHEPVRQALIALPRESEFVFVNGHRRHWTKGAREYQWGKVCTATGWTGSCYLATRHFAGMMMFREMRLSAEDVAVALGHTDKGDLVRKLYGHHSPEDALARVKQAYIEDAESGPDELAKRRRKAA